MEGRGQVKGQLYLNIPIKIKAYKLDRGVEEGYDLFLRLVRAAVACRLKRLHACTAQDRSVCAYSRDYRVNLPMLLPLVDPKVGIVTRVVLPIFFDVLERLMSTPSFQDCRDIVVSPGRVTVLGETRAAIVEPKL